jgi:uncharacterized protein (TIGR00730 family)
MNIAVYCSSSNHIAQDYIKVAYQLGEWIAESGNTLVFGGATGGLMSAVSEGAFSRNGRIIGIIPQAVIRMKRQSPLCTEFIAVDTMSERKALMKATADIFLVLPGSYGTLDEMFDVIASGVVGEHKKPLIILNQKGFYDDLNNWTQRMLSEGFLPVTHQNYKPVIVDNIEKCIYNIQQF